MEVDGVTVAPKDTSEGRGTALGILSEYAYTLSTSKETINLLYSLKEHFDELTDHQKREVELLLRDYERNKTIPQNEFVEYQVLLNDASDVWHKAKETNDFELFRPYLEKVFEYNIKFAKYYQPDKDPYDTTLDQYEKGTTKKQLDEFFSVLKDNIVPLIKKINETKQIDDSVIKGNYPKAKQIELTNYVMSYMGIDPNHCNCGETEHPFTQEFYNGDVRITTHYFEDDFLSSLYSVIHESGHALYELNGSDEHKYTVVSGGTSMGIHESMSRFYENIVGRSKGFTRFLLPKLKELFPNLSALNEEEFYKVTNRSQPSLIRTEADELTYCLHVIIRYEIEKKVFAGELEVKDIPAEWNKLYKEYLGVEVPDDKHGCLQDSHWGGGCVGYFPSYALGSAYGAQFLNKMSQDLDMEKEIESGSLKNITSWLTENIFQYSSMYDPKELFEKVCGEEFNPLYYVNYLKNKYSEIYGI